MKTEQEANLVYHAPDFKKALEDILAVASAEHDQDKAKLNFIKNRCEATLKLLETK